MSQGHLDKFEWVGSIETASGTAFNVVDPDPETFLLSDIVRSLSHICRYNGHVPTFYSVAEHSVRVAAWLDERGEREDVQLTGLLHDAAEAYVGDMVRPLKRLPEFGALHRELEDGVASLLIPRFGGLWPMPEVIHRADRAVYDWEVQNIRSGAVPGWPADVAHEAFLSRFHDLTATDPSAAAGNHP